MSVRNKVIYGLWTSKMLFDFNKSHYLRGGADKSLARPGRKKATATEFGIFFQHTPHEAQYTS